MRTLSLLTASLFLVLTGCYDGNYSATNPPPSSAPKRFINEFYQMRDSDGPGTDIFIIRDDQTKVRYLVLKHTDQSDSIAITPLIERLPEER